MNIKIKYWLVGLAVITEIACRAAAEAPLTVRSDAAEVTLGWAAKGAVASFTTREGVELASGSGGRLFALSFSRQAQPPGECFTATSADAPSFRAATEEGPGGASATLTYEGFTQGVACVVCTVRGKPGDPMLRWRITVEMREGWVLEKIQYPFVALAAPLGTGLDDDAAVLGASKGGVIRKPGGMKTGWSLSVSQPGNMAAQFGCYYDDRAGFYTAAEDGAGYPKDLLVSRDGGGVVFCWSRPCFATGTETQAYDVVMSAFAGTGGAPADWRDAADLYKAWAQTQPWCATLFAERADLPGWMKDAPAMVRFGREWLAETARIERWITTVWKRLFPEMPLITAYWGWEKHGSWVTPDYFPVYPADEPFKELIARTRALGCHAFPWPSGYHWTLTYDKRPDGGFAWDDRERFDRVARAHAVHKREGDLYIREPSWLRGGNTACLCGGDPWTRRWWNEDICVPLVRRGCELIQIDQVVGGNWPSCYAAGHGHPLGRGPWMTEAFGEQLRTMREAMRAIEPDAVVCFEEPNEWFNHLVGLQDYRDCEAPREWASVFNYLYHEYLQPFQSNPRANDRVMAAHCAADGQMPHIVPSFRELEGEVLVNGGFEARSAGTGGLYGWDKLSGYQGKEWTGQAHIDEADRHGGVSSLCLENAKPGDTVQVSQNVDVDDSGFVAGGRYRLSAWLKTERMARQNSVNFAVFAPGLKSTGHGGRLAFPAPGAGWVRVSADFDVPVGAELLRIMCHVDGEAKAWVDDVTLERVDAGGVRPVRHEGLSSDMRFMQKWVALYHGEGRPWLAHGRLLKPPKLSCATITYRDRPTPAVFHNAFRAADGRDAVVLANATHEPQTVTLRWHGTATTLLLEANEVKLIK